MDNLPFLFFQLPKVNNLTGSPVYIPSPSHISRTAQAALIAPQLDTIKATFEKILAFSQRADSGLEPETVLVMEIAGSIQNFKQALDAVGFEWLAEWDEDDIEPNEYFYWKNEQGEKTKRMVSSKLFVSMANQSALQQLLTLWNSWCRDGEFERGTNKWKELFSQLINIRPWGAEESLHQTGMIERWQDLIDPLNPEERIRFQIDFFYRSDEKQRRQLVEQIQNILLKLNGAMLNSCDIGAIRFLAVKAELPASAIKQLLADLENNSLDNAISLLNFPGIMYFKPTGQSISTGAIEGLIENSGVISSQQPEPALAVALDGLPLAQHAVLQGRLVIDDIFELDQYYQSGEQRHGTSMASLIMHGDLNATVTEPINNSLICIPIMQPDPNARILNLVDEHIPDEAFIEERVLKAVEYLVEQKNSTDAYRQVCFVNFSIGLEDQVFHSTLSPLARLIDWLAYTYNLLFFVSAGNYKQKIELGMAYGEWKKLDTEEQTKHIFQQIENNKQARRILSPAESINSLTIGGYHFDEQGGYTPFRRLDPLNDIPYPSLISRIGHGFKQAIKPEIYLPAGRQLYGEPYSDSETQLVIQPGIQEPGHKVALPSKVQGELNKLGYTRGTSNATALATYSAQIIHNHLRALESEGYENIPDAFMPVVIKALLTHSTKQSPGSRKLLESIQNSLSGEKLNKQELARYLGYGDVDLHWLLRNTQQRATVIGWGEIAARQAHEYRFPLPTVLSSRKDWRRVVITLAWLSPINPKHSNFREAKLEIKPISAKWGNEPLKLKRTEQDSNRVKKGTVQHEVLESNKEIETYQDGEELVLQVTCMPDATSHLDETVRYCIAVTLEVKEETNLPIYQQIQQRIQQPVRAAVKVR